MPPGDIDPRALEKLQAAQREKQEQKRTDSVQYKAVERAAQQAGMKVDEYAKSQGTSIDGLIRDMKRGGGGATPGYRLGPPPELDKNSGVKSWWLRGKRKTEAKQEAPPAQTKTPEPEPVEEKAKPNFPVRDMDKGLLDTASFTLANDQKTRAVLLVIEFKNGADPDKMAAVKRALESKLWNASEAEDPEHRGYKPKFVPREGKTPLLVITRDGKIASFIKEMIDAGEVGRIGKTASFIATPDFNAALEMQDIKPRQGLNGGAAKG